MTRPDDATLSGQLRLTAVDDRWAAQVMEFLAVPERQPETRPQFVLTTTMRLVETNPTYWPPARNVRELWRQVKAIFAYSWREARGQLRYEEVKVELYDVEMGFE